MVSFTCTRCSAPFSVKPSRLLRSSKPGFCTMRCYSAHRAEHGRPMIRKPLDQICIVCGAAFRDKPNKIAKGRRFCSNACRGSWQTSLPFDEWRGKLSSNTANRPRGRANPRFGKPPLHPGPMIPYRRRDGSSIKLRSSWEVEVAEYLDAQRIAWEYEPRRFDLGDTTYVPDFYLPDDDCYWEVKGWFNERARRKAAAFRECYPEIPLIMVTTPVMRVLRGQMEQAA